MIVLDSPEETTQEATPGSTRCCDTTIAALVRCCAVVNCDVERLDTHVLLPGWLSFCYLALTYNKYRQAKQLKYHSMK